MLCSEDQRTNVFVCLLVALPAAPSLPSRWEGGKGVFWGARAQCTSELSGLGWRRFAGSDVLIGYKGNKILITYGTTYKQKIYAFKIIIQDHQKRSLWILVQM